MKDLARTEKETPAKREYGRLSPRIAKQVKSPGQTSPNLETLNIFDACKGQLGRSSPVMHGQKLLPTKDFALPSTPAGP